MSYRQWSIDKVDLLISQKYEEAERHRRTEHLGTIFSKLKKKLVFSGLQATEMVEKDASETS